MKNETKKQNRNHMIFYAVFFLAVMFLTFHLIFKNTELDDIYGALDLMHPGYLLAAAFDAVLFVALEGIMIWYLISALHKEYGLPGKGSGVLRCIGYSFIGFFYSGITPSATGGQPMQLYHMNKDGNRLADSSVVLMTVAVIYKLVLSVIGILIYVFWRVPLKGYLGKYMDLFVLGLFLNSGLVLLLLFVMFAPKQAGRVIHKLEQALVKIHLFKYSERRIRKIDSFINGYRESVGFLVTHTGKVLVVLVLTTVQRFSVFVLTWLVYRGFQLTGTPIWDIMWLQAATYISVDMLPIPGSQGITELVYRRAYASVFPKKLLFPSMMAVRGLSFYLVFFIGFLAVIWKMFHNASHES
uniref:lysylphosphatidylglycerol synthase transmembrane domain-containing protein n=1 Tax=Roseburia sp. TaxID=2049040 RepID=UPI003FEDFE68